MNTSIKNSSEKKEYTKPVITEVRLVAKEAVLGTCKDNIGNSNNCQDTSMNCTPGQGWTS